VTLTHLNPATLPTNPVFSQGVRIAGPATCWSSAGRTGSARTAPSSAATREQAAQARETCSRCSTPPGRLRFDVAKLTVYLVVGNDGAVRADPFCPPTTSKSPGPAMRTP